MIDPGDGVAVDDAPQRRLVGRVQSLDGPQSDDIRRLLLVDRSDDIVIAVLGP